MQLLMAGGLIGMVGVTAQSHVARESKRKQEHVPIQLQQTAADIAMVTSLQHRLAMLVLVQACQKFSFVH